MGASLTSPLNNSEASELSSSEDEEYTASATPGRRRGSMDIRNFTTDAIESHPPQIQSSRWGPPDIHVITEDWVLKLEDDLDFYEKVSLVYLLYEDAEIALQHLIQLQHGAHLNALLEWAKHAKKNDINWHSTLLEALCIIQNYQVIAKRGYSKQQVDDRFLPMNSNSSLSVNLLKKKMYRVFENFNNEQTQRFLEFVKRDLTKKKIEDKKFNFQYLEMYMLYWTTVNYITPTNLTNLLKVFKCMEMYDTVDDLKKYCDDVNDPERCKAQTSNLPHGQSFLDVAVPDKSFVSVTSSAGSSVMGEDRLRRNSYEGKSYPVDENFPGICLIINQKHFYKEFDPKLRDLLPTGHCLDDRKGTDVDCNSLNETFKLFGFQVIIKNDRTHLEITTDIEETVKMVAQHSSLIICILSHGITGKVYGVNSIPVDVSTIRNLMCKKNLRGKPKIVILQSCQGTECQKVPQNEEDEDDDVTLTTDAPTNSIPRTADMLLFWATVPGYSAIRDKEKGTWFIQALCKAIRINAEKMHFEDICTMVKNEIVGKEWKTPHETKVMSPLKESTLSKFFFLPSMRAETNS